MSDLHAAIMKIRFSAPSDVAWTTAEIQAAKIGHRDARHAAAELVLSAPAAEPVPPEAVQCKTCDGSGGIDSPELCTRCGFVGCWTDECSECSGTGEIAAAPQPKELTNG